VTGPLDVLVSVTMVRPEERLILDALRERGLTAASALAPDVGAVLNGTAPAPAALLVRNLSHRDAAQVARRAETAGIPALNRAEALAVCHDKGVQALLFHRLGVPHPRSFHAWSDDDLATLAGKLGWPVVVKPLSASWGRGVVRLTGPDTLAAWAGGREAGDPGGKAFPVLVQEYVEKPEHDLRVIVVGTAPVVAIERRSPDWRTNTHLGAKPRRTEVTGEIAGLCAQVTDAIGPGFYGIDLLADVRDGALRVLEVNANPEFARSSREHGVDVAGLLAEYVGGQVRVPAA